MKKVMSICILIAIMQYAYGQRFLHLTSNDGLPDNHARFVYQDASGYIYIGTRSGLSRYDGYNFQIATMSDSIQQLPKEFSAMIETEEGFFTVASSGIYEYIRHRNQLKLSKRLQVLDEACFVEYDGNIFCGTSSGLFLYKDHQWVNSNQLVSGIDEIHIRSMIVSDADELLLGTDKGLFRYGKDMELLETDIGNDPRVHDINSMIQDDKGGFWMSTYSNLYYRDSSLKIVSEQSSLFSNKYIRNIEIDRAGRIWVGGEFGIIIYNPEDQTIQELYRDIVHKQGLNDNAVYSLFRDRDDNMWVGTYFGGINLWNSTFDKFKTYFPGNDDHHLSGKVVRQMQEDDSGNLWLALEDGGINYLDPNTGIIRKYFYYKENEYKNVHSLILDGDMLWVGSFNSGLECYQISHGYNGPSLTKIKSYLENKMIFAISMSEDGFIYIGAVDGIYILDLAAEKLTPYREEVFRNRMIYTLKSISRHELLAGTLRNGLYYCNLESDIITTFSRERAFSSMQNISSIIEVGEGEYAITSSSGLYIFSKEGGKLECILPIKGTTEFRSVLIDDQGSYWVSTTNGLSCFSNKGELLKKYNMYDGLPENQFNFNSAYLTRDGLMYFGTYNGLISLDPYKLKSFVNRIPEVSFTSYTVVRDDKTTLKSVYMDQKQKEIRLKPYQTFLSLEFSTLGYTQSKDLNYEISISGGRWDWDQLLSNRSVTFSHLSKGWHIVKVQPVSEGYIYGPISELKIYKQPAVWQTSYAYVLYLLLLVIVFFYARREFFRRQNSKNTLALERYEKENQKLLNDQKMRFFLNISHEFRTPLTIIGGTISNILRKYQIEKEIEAKLNTIQNTSDNLNKLVNDFLDYGKLDAGFKPLEVKKNAVLPFVETTCNMFDNWAEVNQLTYKKDIQNSTVTGFFDPEKLERVIYNLLSNAFKFNRSNGRVEVSAYIDEIDNETLEIVISDTGSGIPDDLVREIRKHFEYDSSASLSDKSIGLAYTAGLVRQMKGSIEVKSELGSGSVFKVTVPLSEPDPDLIFQGLGANADSVLLDESDNEFETIHIYSEKIRPEVFIIDDNVDLLEMLKENLESDYKVTVASSPKLALAKILHKEYALIICDIMMPEMNGFEVIETLQSNIHTSHIPIIVLTAAAEKNIEQQGYRKGAISYLAKPFKNEELRLKIESILSFRRELITRFGNEHDLPVEEIVCSKQDELFISRASEVVFSHLSNYKFDVNMFCSEMNVSRTLLHNKLKNISGLSTTEFIRTIRLKHAYVLLKKESLNISEVALKCGFNDASYFSKCFKKKFGVHPSKVN